MSNKTQSVKGMIDLLPESIGIWHFVEKVLRDVAWQYGYQELRTPLLEKTQLFKQSIGDQTDIVEKEMYTFNDSGGESLTLRPEATASAVRACVQHGLLYNKQQRLWYMGPMFRRERPQKGRYRQFYQFGIEAFGWTRPDIDAEIIHIGERIWSVLGVKDIALQINTLGSNESRSRYIVSLRDYLTKYYNDLDEDSRRRLEKNPLRILDSKSPVTQQIVEDAPKILDFLSVQERVHFDGLCGILEESKVIYHINSKLVRGLDYYTSTVFEWTTEQLGAQSAVCGGGRYDTLVEQRGGRLTPGIGFAMGVERLIELLQTEGAVNLSAKLDIYVAVIEDDRNRRCSIVNELAEKLRDLGLKVTVHIGGGKLKTQMKKADQSQAALALIIGDEEIDQNTVVVKHLRENIEQHQVDQADIISWCQSYFDK